MNKAKVNVPPIWFLALCTASAVIGLTALTPAVPIIKSELNVSADSVQLLLTAYLFALAFGQLICGPLSDRTGRRPVLLGGAFVFSVAGVATTLTQDINLLIVLRFVQGLGASACMAMGRSMVNDAFEREDAARTMSTISTVLAIAPALSLAFGGVLAESTGWKGIMTLLATAAIGVLVGSYYLVNETNLNRHDSISLPKLVGSYSTVLSNKLFLCWSMAGAMQIGIFFSLNAFLSYQFQRNGYSMSEFGIWFALTPVSYIVGNTCNRLWLVSRGLERVALVGCVLSLISIIAMFTTQAMGMTHALSLAIPCMLFGFSNGIVVANTTVGAMSSAGDNAGTGVGIAGAWQMAASGISGALIVALGGDQVFAVAIAVLFTMSLIGVISMLIIRQAGRANA